MAKEKRNELIFFEDILECIQKIKDYIQNVSEHDFEKNNEKQDAVIRRIEIIGEAVKSISLETRHKYPDIPWREIAGMRDVVIHEYFGVSIGMVWRVATKDLPLLEEQIKTIVQENYTL